jgi:hypothetical protein
MVNWNLNHLSYYDPLMHPPEGNTILHDCAGGPSPVFRRTPFSNDIPCISHRLSNQPSTWPTTYRFRPYRTAFALFTLPLEDGSPPFRRRID